MAHKQEASPVPQSGKYLEDGLHQKFRNGFVQETDRSALRLDREGGHVHPRTGCDASRILKHGSIITPFSIFGRTETTELGPRELSLPKIADSFLMPQKLCQTCKQDLTPGSVVEPGSTMDLAPRLGGSGSIQIRKSQKQDSY